MAAVVVIVLTVVVVVIVVNIYLVLIYYILEHLSPEPHYNSNLIFIMTLWVRVTVFPILKAKKTEALEDVNVRLEVTGISMVELEFEWKQFDSFQVLNHSLSLMVEFYRNVMKKKNFPALYFPKELLK